MIGCLRVNVLQFQITKESISICDNTKAQLQLREVEACFILQVGTVMSLYYQHKCKELLIKIYEYFHTYLSVRNIITLLIPFSILNFTNKFGEICTAGRSSASSISSSVTVIFHSLSIFFKIQRLNDAYTAEIGLFIPTRSRGLPRLT